jgi:hypothetical protein
MRAATPKKFQGWPPADQVAFGCLTTLFDTPCHTGLFNQQRAVGYSGPPMMLVFHDKYREIDPLWHVRGLGETAGERYSKSFLENANLLHWSGVNKPWGRIEAAMGRDVWDTYYLPDPWHRFKVIRKAKSKSSRLDH